MKASRARWLFSVAVLAALIVSVLPPVSPVEAQRPIPPTAPAAPESLTTPPAVNCPDGQFVAKYYNNETLADPVAATRCEDMPVRIDGTLAVPGDADGVSYSVRYTGKFRFEAKQYVFLLRAEDGARIKLDGTTVLDKWTYPAATTVQAYTTPTAMTAGLHTVEIQYHQATSTRYFYAGWLPVMGATETCAVNTLRADYYANNARTAPILFSRCEDVPIANWWGSIGGPFGLAPGAFSVHWNGTVDGTASSAFFPPGATRYTGQVSGHMVAKVDGATIFANLLTADGEQRYDATVSAAATHTIDVTYESTAAGVAATARFGWSKAPSACGVTQNSPLGKDEELLWAGATTSNQTAYQVAPQYGFRQGLIPPFTTWPNVAHTFASAGALVLDADTTILAGLDGSGHMAWDQIDGRGVVTPTSAVDTTAMTGPLALVKRNPLSWVAFGRPSSSQTTVKYREINNGVAGAWKPVQGVTNTASSLAVVSPSPSQMLLFYKDSANSVWFTEWLAGQWRDQPIKLGGTIISDLTAVAPSGTDVSLLGIGSDNHAYVRGWTPANDADWSDTSWKSLGTWHCKNEPIAAIASDVNHITAACRGDPNNVGYWQWTGNVGWTATAALTNVVAGAGPLTLVAPDRNKLWLLWADTANLYRVEWTKAGGWNAGISNTQSGLSSSSAPGQVLAVAPQPGVVHHFMKISGTYRDLWWGNTDNAVTTSLQYQTWGTLRGEALIKAKGKTVWIETYRDPSTGVWKLFKVNPATGTVFSIWDFPVEMTGGPAAAALESLTYGDVDQDGDDEVAVFLSNGSGSTTGTIYSLDFTGWTNGIPVATTKTATVSAPSGITGAVSAAIGDLDGDNKRSELILFAKTTYYATYWLYQWDPTASGGANFVQRVAQTSLAAFHEQGEDLQVAAGRVRLLPGEQVVLARSHCPMAPFSCISHEFDVTIHRFYKDTAGVWQREDLVRLHDEGGQYPMMDVAGPFSTALALGDVDLDGLKEIGYTVGDAIYVLGGDAAASTTAYSAVDYPDLTRTIGFPWSPVQQTFGLRTLAMGDVNLDGRAEIVLSYGPQSGGSVAALQVYSLRQPQRGRKTLLLEQAASASGSARIALIGDVDNDSWMAELIGCQNLTDAHVTAVINGPPRYYNASNPSGDPLQMGSGRFGVTKQDTTGVGMGTSYSVGGSISAGFKQDFEVSTPFYDVHVGSVYFNVTNEFESTFGKTVETYNTTTESEGWSFGGNGDSAYKLGIVVYTATSNACYAYDVYNPSTPADKSRTVLCMPLGPPNEQYASIEHWNTNEEHKREMGSSWFHLGHDSNNLDNYPSVLPSKGTSITWVKNTGILVNADEYSGYFAEWGLQRNEGREQVTTSSFEDTTKVAVGGDVFGVTFETSASFGVGMESSRKVGWESGLEISGSVEKFYNCPTCEPYTVKPYVATTQARTLDGNSYDYLVADYIVTCKGTQCTGGSAPEEEIAAEAALGLAPSTLPQAPEVTSPTHPDPNAWYAGKDVTFNWQQPAGDPATVKGYTWQLTEKPDTLPSAGLDISTTMTYHNVPDGLHYMHVTASSGGIAGLGPTTHRAVRVDANPPKVTIALNPPSPNLNGWFKTPVVATITADDGLGSGAALVEYSTDGSTWLPYTAPVTFANETAGFTLSARATDGVGHVSEIAQREIKIDLTPPSTVDVDSYGLSYARIDQDESGNNVQLVLGGALNDNLSGRSQVELSAGENAGWRAVDAVGVFPMPPGNTFPPGQATTLNWIYTPTFEIRGVYNIYGHGLDQAGNIETGWGSSPIGTLFWPPDGNPNLAESRLTASPSVAKAGDTVRFTLGLRNSGVQEAAVIITSTVPSGLTVLPASISSGGTYDAASHQVTWQVHAAWQKQVQYLTYAATVDPGCSGDLMTQAALMAYWPGYENDPTKVFNSTLSNVVTVAASAPAEAPGILRAIVNEGPVVGNPAVTFDAWTSNTAQYLYVKEWTLDPATAAWTQVAASGWLPIANGAGMTLFGDGPGKHLRYGWTLAHTEGVHYLGIWAGDASQQPSNLNEYGLLFTNLLGTPSTLAAGQRTQYRLPLNQNELAILTLATTGGDADLHVWKPRAGFKPAYWSNAAGTPPALDSLAFYAPESGDYLVEVQAVTDASFTLALGGALHPAGAENEAPGGALPASVHSADKARPDHPFALTTPFSLAGADVPGDTVPVTPIKLYLPLIRQGRP